MTHHKYACAGCGAKIEKGEKLCVNCQAKKDLNILTFECQNPQCKRKHDRDPYLDSLWKGLCRECYDDWYFNGFQKDIEFNEWLKNKYE